MQNLKDTFRGKSAIEIALTVLVIIGGIFSVIGGLMIVHALIEGYVLHKLWSWLILPTFPALPQLSIPAAIGVSIVAAVLTNHTQGTEKGKSEKSNALMHIFVKPFLYLLSGYIVSRYI